MAKFLNFYPQYRLKDLGEGGELSVVEFVFLSGGMLDVTDPQSTETDEERINRATREAHVNAVQNSKKRGW